jgi:hypothetical protein
LRADRGSAIEHGDDAVDQEELKNGGMQRFQAVDTDANGELSTEEWMALSRS